MKSTACRIVVSFVCAELQSAGSECCERRRLISKGTVFFLVLYGSELPLKCLCSDETTLILNSQCFCVSDSAYFSNMHIYCFSPFCTVISCFSFLRAGLHLVFRDRKSTSEIIFRVFCCVFSLMVC